MLPTLSRKRSGFWDKTFRKNELSETILYCCTDWDNLSKNAVNCNAFEAVLYWVPACLRKWYSQIVWWMLFKIHQIQQQNIFIHGVVWIMVRQRIIHILWLKPRAILESVIMLWCGLVCSKCVWLCWQCSDQHGQTQLEWLHSFSNNYCTTDYW